MAAVMDPELARTSRPLTPDPKLPATHPNRLPYFGGLGDDLEAADGLDLSSDGLGAVEDVEARLHPVRQRHVRLIGGG